MHKPVRPVIRNVFVAWICALRRLPSLEGRTFFSLLLLLALGAGRAWLPFPRA